MDQYVTAETIKRLRERKNLTQEQLGELIHVSGKAVSRWETGRGYPDISLLEPLSATLGVSIIELLSGNDVVNTNKTANINRISFYVCPVCGNVISSIGQSVVSCCGISLHPLEAEEPDGEHPINVEISDGEFYVTVDHVMSKEHNISFLAFAGDDRMTMVKQYPEWSCSARFALGSGTVYAYCNHHGLYGKKVRPPRRKPLPVGEMPV